MSQRHPWSRAGGQNSADEHALCCPVLAVQASKTGSISSLHLPVLQTKGSAAAHLLSSPTSPFQVSLVLGSCRAREEAKGFITVLS